MSYTYYLNERVIYDESGKQYIVYGIDAVSSTGIILQSFPDIFFSKQKAEHLVDLCNNNKLALVHLLDVIEDALAEQYDVL